MLLNMNLCELSKSFLDVIFTWVNISFQSSEVENALFTVTSNVVSDSQVSIYVKFYNLVNHRPRPGSVNQSCKSYRMKTTIPNYSAFCY